MKRAIFILLIGTVLSGPVWGVEVKPVNFVMPPSAGNLFSFDFVVTSPPAQAAYTSQLTLDSVSPAGLTFNISGSQSVVNNTSYWVYGNSQGTPATDNGDGSFSFGDGPENSIPETISNGDILARFAFLWNGTPGDFVFTLDRNTSSSYIRRADFLKDAFTLPSGQWYSGPVVGATDSTFTVHIPEPVSITLLGLGALAILRKRQK